MYHSEVTVILEGISDLFLDSHDKAIGRAEDNLLEVCGADGDEGAETALDIYAGAINEAWSKVSRAAFLSGLAHGASLGVDNAISGPK